MKCNNCGAEISDEARFCEKCGARVDADAASGEKCAPAASGSELDGLDALPDDAEPEEIPAPKPLEQPLSAGAVPFVPMAPAPRGMPRSMRAPRPYEPRPGFSPVQPGTQKPKRAASFAGLGQKVPPAPDPVEPARERADEAAVAASKRDWEAYPASKAAEELPAREPASQGEWEREFDRERAEEDAARAQKADREVPAAADPNSTAQLRVPDAPTARPAAGASDASAAAPSAASRKAGLSPRVIAALAAVVVIAIVGVCAAGMLGRPASEPAPAPSTNQSEPATSDANAAEDPTDSGNDADSVAVRSSVEDYSWDELSQISAQIAAASSGADGLDIAKRYNLCTSAGELDGMQTKKLQLSDGTKVTMRIVGFRQDQLADGSGVAGITMVSEDAVGTRHISTAGTASGWEGSELRTWMNGTLADELPDEVASKLREVSKKTNGQAATTVTTTSDKLWIPSFSEVVGKLTSGMKRADVYTPEGDQYQLFANADVQWGGTYSVLSTSGSDDYWWLRSVDPLNSQYYLCVSQAGEPWYSHLPATEHAILMGFCL